MLRRRYATYDYVLTTIDPRLSIVISILKPFFKLYSSFGCKKRLSPLKSQSKKIPKNICCQNRLPRAPKQRSLKRLLQVNFPNMSPSKLQTTLDRDKSLAHSLE